MNDEKGFFSVIRSEPSLASRTSPPPQGLSGKLFCGLCKRCEADSLSPLTTGILAQALLKHSYTKAVDIRLEFRPRRWLGTNRYWKILWSLYLMSETKVRVQVIEKGARPPCLKSGYYCRECLGWRKMIHAARTNHQWRKFPFRCAATRLTLKLEAKG